MPSPWPDQIYGVDIEAHELVEHPAVHRELDDRAAAPVPAPDVAVLEHVMEQRPGLGVRWER
jgi:hypothetical protein